MRLFKQLIGVFAVILLIIGALAIFAFDVIKIDWIVFMEIQDSYASQEKPLPVPAQSIPVEGAAYIPGNGAPTNPVPADEISIARGAQLFATQLRDVSRSRRKGEWNHCRFPGQEEACRPDQWSGSKQK